VRFLLEEGKLNLCVRLMQTYCQAAYAYPCDSAEYEQWASATASASGMPVADFLKKILLFEQSLGVLLRCALEHVEATQTTDLPLLFQHCAELLAACGAGAVASFDSTQPAMVLRYLHSIVIRREQLGEDRVAKMIAQHKLVPLVCAHLHVFAPELQREGQLSGSSFLAGTFDTEEFETNRRSFLSPDGHRTAEDQLRTFKSAFLSDLVAEADIRKQLRPLLDVVERC